MITREFDAPRELVFKAFTDPELYTQWLGPRKYAMNLEKFEPRSGGMWRYTHKDKDGNEFGFHGVYSRSPTGTECSRVERKQESMNPTNVSTSSWKKMKKGE